MKKTRIIWQCDSCGGVYEEDNIEGCGKVEEYLLEYKRGNGTTSAEVDLCKHCKMSFDYLLKVLRLFPIENLKLIKR
jgi:hypothetical protein